MDSLMYKIFSLVFYIMFEEPIYLCVIILLVLVSAIIVSVDRSTRKEVK